MSEQVDHIYCGDNSNTLAAALMANKGNDNAALAAMMNNNNWMNNPFAYLIWLIFAGRMFGDNNCDIINNQNANTQKIIDLLNGHWTAGQALEIQDLKFQNSQLKQNQYIASLVSGGCPCTTPNL